MKKLLALILAVAICVSMTACGNKTFFDTTYTFDRAIIELPNGEIVDGEVQAWSDYEGSDQIQVKIDDTTYLVHSSQIVLIAE